MRNILIVSTALAMFFTCAFADTIHVPGDYPTIQAGINAAVNGDTVLVADGTYTGTGNKNIDFGGRAIVVMSENGAENCIIDCENMRRGFYFHLGEDSNSVVLGFKIINGYVTGGWPDNCGGGILCIGNSSPSIKNCILSENSANNKGGGINCMENSSPTIVNCTFSENSANYKGGGINCEYSSPTVENCTFSGNSVDYFGGGIRCFESSPSILNCTFSGNSAYDYGGGIDCSHSSPSIENCTFSGNSVNQRGGGIRCGNSNPTIENCTISGNSAGDEGGGICCYYNSSPTIQNCTLSGNSALTHGGGICCYSNSNPTGVNNIIWVNTAPTGSQIYLYPGCSFSCTYSDIQGGWPGVGNIDADPLFVDTTRNDYRLQWGSPCIDAGDPNPIYYDPDGTVTDMGAFYYDQSIPLRVLLTPHDMPIQIPAGGGSFDFTIYLTNIDPLSLVPDVWCNATLPNGHISGPVLGPVSVDIGSGVTLSRERTQNVPGGAPAGTYSYNAYATAGSDTSTDSFTFFKEGADGGYLGSPSDWICTGEPFTGEEMVSIHPSEFILHPSFPNPFNASTIITFELQVDSYVELVVYDVMGREVASLVNGYSSLGEHAVVWDAGELSSGVYFARLYAGELMKTQKLILIK